MKKTLFLLLVAFLFGCSSNKQENSNAQTTTQSSEQYKENVSLVVSVEKGNGNAVPNFSFTNEKGEHVNLAELAKGKAVLINFWATWCGPCVKEIPDLIALHSEFQSKGGMVIGISVDRDSDVLSVVSNFSKEKGINYSVVIDNGNLEQAFGGIRGIPTTFMITKDGQISKKIVGLQSKEIFEKELRALL